MSFNKLNLGPSEAVLATVTKKQVQLILGPAVVRVVGWTEDEPNVSVALGDGDDAGWLRIFLDEDGSTPEGIDGRLHLVLPRSALPDLSTCRSSPLTWRSTTNGIDVRLPTIAPVAVAGKPQLRSVPRSSPEPDKIEDVEDDRPMQIGPPALYAQLHREAWAAGIEVHFLSNGDCVVNGKICDVDDIERSVRRAGERRSSDVARAVSVA